MVFSSTSGAQDTQTIEHYFQAYVEARDATVDGVRARYELLQQGAAANATFNALDKQTRDHVFAAYQRYGFTPTSHLEFGTVHRDAVNQWLESNNATEQRLNNLSSQVDELSEKIRAIQEEG